MTVTVGIATLGREPEVLRRAVRHAIESALRTSSDAEVLVVINGGATVPDIAPPGTPALRVLSVPEASIAGARNLILDEARHDMILFTDEDCVAAPEWCMQMSAALRAGSAVVTGPVRMEVAGPISAYFDYQRLYDSTPAGTDRSSLTVTANCGVRRDLLPPQVRFEKSLRAGGEDTHFGLTVAAAGLTVRHLTDATPIRHGLSEDITEITRRGLRNARVAPRMYLHFGFGEVAMPDALELYRDRISDSYRFYRTFTELAEPAARTAFTVYDAINTNLALVGYLDGLGTELGYRLVDLDTGGLEAVWSRIAEAVVKETAGLSASDWATLSVDCRRVGEPASAPEPLLAEVRAAFRRYAAPAVAPDGPAADVLRYGRDEQVAACLSMLGTIQTAWSELCSSDEPVSTDAANRVARAHALPYHTACEMISIGALIGASSSRRRVGARS